MLLRITVIDPSRSHRSRDVLVDAVSGSTATELAAALDPTRGVPVGSPEPVGARSRCGLSVEGRALEGDELIGMPPLLDGAVVTVGATNVGRPRPAPGVLELHVVAGPDAGQVFRLPPGEHRLGRSVEAGLRLDDPDVSRVHAIVTVASTAVTVTDLSSTNGTTLDGSPVDGTATMHPDGVLAVGRSALRLRPPDGTPASTRPDGLGHLLVNRSPRVVPDGAPTTVTFPDAPTDPARSRLPWLTLIVPVALSGTLALLMRSPTMLLFGLSSPVLMLASWVGERRGGGQRQRRSRLGHTAAVAGATLELDAALREEAATRRRAHPDLATVLGVVDGRQSRVWERRRDDPDSLVVRIGTGRLPATTTASGEAAPPGPFELDDLPVTLDLRTLGVSGVAGPRAHVLGVARTVMAQLACWHSPRDLRVVVLTDAEVATDWSGSALLPHTAAEGTRRWVASRDDGPAIAEIVAELTRELLSREGRRPTADRAPAPDIVVILDGAAELRTVPGLTQLLDRGPAVGLAFLALDLSPERLPVEASCVVTAGPDGTATVRLPRASPVAVVLDAPQPRWSERLARSMAPLRDATPGARTSRIPTAVRLLDLLRPDALDPTRLAAAWTTMPRSTEVLLGADADGSVRLDLRHDGPHALVAGTTGAGKSELLQTLIASLALGNRPDELSFVLIDYKGGSAFHECARLPHTVGVVTDLDDHLTERALTSLGAELRRRERLLAAAGATDLDDYLAMTSRAAPTHPPIPRLVLVIDEFRLLAEELPDFVQGLVRIAAVGRSLGVHLVLATQRPGGIVSADIRANVGLRIALRVRDRADSTDVVEAADAASISERTPGRAFVRSAATPLTELQTARVRGVAAPRPRVIVAPPSCPPPEPAPDPQDATDLRLVVEATRAAARLHGIPAAPPPWLPPLATVVPLESLTETDGVPIGLRDNPIGQSQATFAWDLEGGHLGIAGGPGSGRTTALRTLAGSLATRFGPHELHLYAVQSGALGGLTSLPHTAVVAGRDDLALVDRVISRLVDLTRQRREELASTGVATISEHRDAAARLGRAPLPWLVLLIDDWESLTQAVEAIDYGRPAHDLLRLLRDGGSLGLRVAVTGERAVLAGQLSSLLTTRLALRVTDPVELALAGIPAKAVPAHQSPGRSIDVRDHSEIQLAVLGADASPATQAARLAEIARHAEYRWQHIEPALRPRPVRSLPHLVGAADLAADPRWANDRGHLLVGIREGDLGAVGFDLSAGQRRILVIGSPRTGRSTALVTIVGSLLSAGRPVAWVGAPAWALTARRAAARGSGAEALGEVTAVSAEATEDLIALRRRHPDLAVVVDDAERLVGTPVEAVLREVIRLVDEDDGVVVASTSPAALVGVFSGVPAELARLRTGLLMSPAPGDGDLLGIRLGSPLDRLPGRAVLVAGGRSETIQVASL